MDIKEKFSSNLVQIRSHYTTLEALLILNIVGEVAAWELCLIKTQKFINPGGILHISAGYGLQKLSAELKSIVID